MLPKRVKIIREVKKYGTSLGIRLGMDLVNQLDIKEGSIVEAEINKIERFDESDRYVIHCDTPIIIKEGEPIIDCPICGKELDINNMEVKI